MIRRATLTHTAALTDLEHRCFPTDKLDEKHFRYLVKSKSVRVYIYQRRKSIIAAAIVLFRKNSKIARLYSIAVDPTYQRNGIAKKLYLKVEQELFKRKMQELRLEAREDNKRAIQFYLKNGFEVSGKELKYYQDGMNALRMKKTLYISPKLKSNGRKHA